MLTRREFIGAGLGAAVATHAFALPGDKMRYAMSGHQFRGLKPHPETGIKMAAQYGYHGLEPFQDDMPQYLKQPPEVFKKLLDDAGIALCTVGSGGQYLDAARIQDDHREQRRAREIRRALRLQTSEGEPEPARRPRKSERGKRKDPRAQPQRSGEADDGCRHQVRVSSARVDARRAPARARHDDGADRSEVRLPRARHGTRHARRDRSGKGAARLLSAGCVDSSERRRSEVQHRARLARPCAQRRRAQARQSVQAPGQRRRRFRRLLRGAAPAQLRRVGDDGLRHAATRRRHGRRRHEPAQGVSDRNAEGAAPKRKL